MKKLFVALCAIVMVFGTLGMAGAVLIDFEELTLGQVGQIKGTITNSLFNSYGMDNYVFTNGPFSFSHNGPFMIDDGTWYTTTNATTNFLVSYYLPMLANGPDQTYYSPLVISFHPASEVSLDFFAGGNGTAWYRVYALIGNDNILSEMVFQGDQHISFSNLQSPISQLWIGDAYIGGPLGSTHAGFSVDNLYMNPVPEPGTILLLGAGLIGLAGFRRKFKI